MKVYVRLFDEADNKYDIFIGPAAECPPLPREGDLVTTGHVNGRVVKIEHDYGQSAEAVFIALRLSEL